MAASAYCVFGGLLTLVGWITDTQRLTAWKNDGISMFPNTAMCAVLGGAALALVGSARGWRAAARVAAGVLVAIVGAVTLLEHLTGVNTGIDTLLFSKPWGQTAAAAPMRMGPPASASFAIAGVALVLLNLGSRARATAAVLGAAVAGMAMLSLTGHLYGAQQMYTVPRLTGIAMQSASMLFALGLGIVASAPDREPMRTLLQHGAAGLLVRRALPLIVLLALALGWVRVWIQEAGLVDTAFGTALRTLVEIGLLTTLLWWAVRKVHAHEDALIESEVEVRRQAAQLEAFLQNAAIGVHRVGPDGTIVWANDAELKMLGYARDEYVGHSIAEFHADSAVLPDLLARLRRAEKLVEFPARMRCRDGSVKAVLIDSSVLWDEDAKLFHTQCFTRDVTEQERAEASRAMLAAIIETSHDAIVSKSLEGRITSWNDAAQRIFGYSAEEMVGEPIDVIIPPDRRGEEREILARLRRGERIDHFDTVRCAKDGRLLDVSLTISPVRDRSGRIIGASKIARDITERRSAEREREESSRRKDEFIAILAHELRNPLAPIRNAARYISLKGRLDPDLARPVAMIERQVAQMSRLIDDLLDVSRISRGTLELRLERLSLVEVLEDAVESCSDAMQAKGQTLHCDIPAIAIGLDADRARLFQVFCNLIGNAIKYTPPGGRLAISVTTQATDSVAVSLKDSGVGIDPDKLSEIFEPFVRLEQSLERQDGLGIGLTLARQLVELHQGTIEARSEGVGRGTEFIVTLPAASFEAMVEEEELRPTPAGDPLRILVADDNQDSVESLLLLLRLSGHDVRGAFDGEAAFEIAAQFRPQVAILDIGMPKANGYQAAQRIRSELWGRDIVLIALTGWGQEADKRRAHAAGFDTHLVKPVSAETLDEMLATVARCVSAPMAS